MHRHRTANDKRTTLLARLTKLPRAVTALHLAGACLALLTASTAWAQTLTGLALTSDPGDDDTYIADDIVEVTATFDIGVSVTGNPAVRVLIGPEERTAVYWTGAGQELLFRYTVVAGDLDEDGISIGGNRLDLNTATITGVNGTAATVTHEAIENQSQHKVDAVAPSVLAVSVLSDPGDDEVYTTGDAIEIGVLFDETMAITGQPTITIALGDHGRRAEFTRTEGETLVFAYLVRAEDQDDDGIAVEANAVSVGDGTITDAVGNPAGLSHAPLVSQAAHKVAGVSLPVSGIHFVSDAGDDDTYAAGDAIGVAVVFGSNVSVSGQPTLRLQIGENARNAAFQTGQGGNLLFAYTVVEGDLDDDGVSIEQDALALSGGSVVDGNGSPVDLGHAAVEDQTRHKVDAVSPFVERIGFVSDAGEDGSYAPGDVVEAAVVFTEAVVVNGSPRLGLRVGANDRIAEYAGNDGPALRFQYTVVSDDYDEDGVSVRADALVASGAELRDRAGNPALLAHDALPDQGDHRVDGVAPAVATVGLTSDPGADNTYGVGDVIEATVTFVEAVDVSGAPAITIRVGTAAKQADYADGSGATAIRFRYVVVEGDVDADGVSVPADAVVLNGGGITDLAGNVASLAHSAIADDAAHKVFTTLPSAVGTIADMALTAGGEAGSVELGPLFGGVGITFSAVSADTGVATVEIAGTVLTVRPHREGATVIEATATNVAGGTALDFAVTVSTDATEKAVLADTLAGVGRSMLSGTADVFDGRFALAPSGAPQSARNWDGAAVQSGVDSAGWANGMAWTTDGDDPVRHRLPVGSVFNLALDGGGGGWTIWGARYHRRFEGKPGNGGYSGDSSAGFVGLERRGGNWLAGLSVAGNTADVEYDFSAATNGRGELETEVYGIYPYAHFGRTGDTQLWFVGGFGLGEITAQRAHIDGETGTGSSADLRMSMGLAGLRQRLPWRVLGSNLAVRGDAGVLNLQTEDGLGALNELDAGVSSVRLGVEAAWRFSGLEPFAEASGRFDGGDGETGIGIEFAGGVRLPESVLGVGLEAKGRVLALHSAAGYAERGFSLIASVAPSARGQGFRLRVAPRWGAPTDGMDMFRSGGAPWDRVQRWRSRPGWGVDASVGYGFARPSAGMVTPFGELTRTGSDQQRLRLGVRYRLAEWAAAPLWVEMAAEQVADEARFTGRDRRFVLTAKGAL